MGIFGAKRVRLATVTAPTWTRDWQPDPAVGGHPFLVARSDVEDDGCAADVGWGARFLNPGAPGSVLTVSCYPSYAGPDRSDGYIVGYRVDYACAAGWTWTDHTSEAARNGGVEFDVRYLDLDRAISAAQIKAGWLLEGNNSVLPPPGCLRAHFDWDGRS